MQCGGLWFANGKFGVTWKLAQAVVQRPKPSLLDECLIKLKPSDKAKLKAQNPVDLDEEAVVNTTVMDSDEEDGDEEEETTPVMPPQPPVPVTVPEPVAVAAAAVPIVAVADEPKKVVKKVVKKKASGDA
jgi:hypothetical protein